MLALACWTQSAASLRQLSQIIQHGGDGNQSLAVTYARNGIPSANVAMVCQGRLRLIASLAVSLTLQCNHLVPLQRD